MGKGSKRRLEQVPDKQIQKNWDKIFGKTEDRKTYKTDDRKTYDGRKNSINSRKRTKSTD